MRVEPSSSKQMFLMSNPKLAPGARVAVLSLCAPMLSFAQNSVVGWGASAFDSRWNTESFSQVASGPLASVAVRMDGTLAA